ncbi:hypothetical protein ABTF85_19295, partial [Acinetobacter baumannii]
VIDEANLRADDFDGFMEARRARLLALIEGAMGKEAVRESVAPVVSGEDFYAEDEEALAEAA